jgi:probable HAF family extracellular repeat protein
MGTLRQLRNFWILWITTIVLACFSNAVAQVSYKVTDLGVLPNRNLGCAMGLNNRGWTEVMEGTLIPGQENSASGRLLNGRAAIDIDGINLDLGTLGGKNTWMWYGGLNDEREAVGYSETSVPDPNGEDVCAFGTGLTCSAFLWKNGSMSALPTLGGNNGQASAINNHGQIAGYAENGIVDGTCPTTFRNNRIDLPVLWENGNAQPLPTVGRDPDGVAFGINNQGQATGYSGTCTLANHAVLWENDFAVPLPDLGVPGASEGFGINDLGQIIGITANAEGTTYYAAVWPNRQTIISLNTLPGDVNSLGEGINNQGQAVGSTLDSNGNWSHAFLWQNGVMTDLNTLLPASSNLYATMANQINDRGQISGMAVVLSGPEVGTIHAFLATPVNASVGMSVAEVARTHPKITLPANVGNQLLQRLRLGQFGR